MAISTNSVFHFTKNKKALVGILNDDFKIKYCLEEISLDSKNKPYAAPMVSFCDIPLSEVKKHIKSYGSYGIGLSKEWAIRNGLNPVIYVEKDSTLSESLYQMLQVIKKNVEIQEDKKPALDIVRYIKNYENTLYRKNRKPIEKYRFSDEREWRYVPPFTNTSFSMILTKDSYSTDDQKNMQNQKLADLRLTFRPDDITYIIVKEEKEISEILKILVDVKSTHNYNDVEKLKTRIITAHQILNDF